MTWSDNSATHVDDLVHHSYHIFCHSDSGTYISITYVIYKRFFIDIPLASFYTILPSIAKGSRSSSSIIKDIQKSDINNPAFLDKSNAITNITRHHARSKTKERAEGYTPITTPYNITTLSSVIWARIPCMLLDDKIISLTYSILTSSLFVHLSFYCLWI